MHYTIEQLTKRIDPVVDSLMAKEFKHNEMTAHSNSLVKKIKELGSIIKQPDAKERADEMKTLADEIYHLKKKLFIDTKPEDYVKMNSDLSDIEKTVLSIEKDVSPQIDDLKKSGSETDKKLVDSLDICKNTIAKMKKTLNQLSEETRKKLNTACDQFEKKFGKPVNSSEQKSDVQSPRAANR